VEIYDCWKLTVCGWSGAIILMYVLSDRLRLRPDVRDSTPNVGRDPELTLKLLTTLRQVCAVT
jgi:hypothetical protein